jgi:hypothetical protein
LRAPSGLSKRRLPFAAAGTLTVEESKEKAERPLPARFAAMVFRWSVVYHGSSG